MRVNSVPAGGQHLPTVTVGPGGQVYVTWVDCLTDEDCTTSNPDIYFARSTDGGQSFQARMLVSDDGPAAFANAPKIATDDEGTIYVVWQDNRAATSSDDSWDVYLSRSTDGGLTFSPSVRVDDHVANAYQYEPDLAVTPAGTVYVSWQRYAYDGSLGAWDSDVYVATSTDGGSSFGANVKVSDGANNQFKSTIAVGPSGNVYVAWSDFRDDSYGDVFFARSTDGAGSFSPNVRVNSYASQAQVYPELAVDANERLYVVWLDARRAGDAASDVYMARSTDLGLSFDSEHGASDADLPGDAVAQYLYPVVTAASDGLAAVAWYDTRTGDWDTYLTRSFDAGLTTLPSWRVNDLTANSQSVPDVFMGPGLDVYCVYRDHSSGDFDIYFVLDTTLTATQTLGVTKAGAGAGTVTSAPAGIECGSACTASFASNQLVTLSAAADAGSTFSGWSGEGCSGTDACQVTMDQGRSVTATFTLDSYSLSVTRTGTGTGTVTSDPGGIACGATCSASFPYNSTVRLDAEADAGSTFSGWSGEGCGGTGTCQVTMSQSRSVTATFVSTSPAGASFYTVKPCRLADTRKTSAPSLAAGGTRTFMVTGECGIPANAMALAVNVTVTNTKATGHLRLWPADVAMPVTSTLNFQAGQTRANNATLALADDGTGTIKVLNAAPATVDFILDVSGYYR